MIGFSKMAYDALAEGPNGRIPSDPKIMWKKSKLATIWVFLCFTNAAGQEAPTSVSRERNALFCGVFPFYNIVVRQNIWYNNLGEERRFMYATDNYSKNSDFS